MHIQFKFILVLLIFLPLFTDLTAQTKEEMVAEAEKAFNRAVELSKTDNDDAALSKFKTAQELYHRTNEKRNEANSFRGIGKSYLGLKRREEAIEAYQKALHLFEEINRDPAIVVTAAELSNILASSISEKDLYLALKYYDKELAAHNRMGEKEEVARVQINMGRVFAILKKEREALSVLEPALVYFRKIKKKQWEAETLSFIGNVLDMTGQPLKRLKALVAFGKAIELYGFAETKEAKSGKANALLNLGNLHSAFGRPEEAAMAYLAAIDLYRELDYQTEVATGLDNLGVAFLFYLSLDSLTLEKKNKAIIYAEQILATNRKGKDPLGICLGLFANGMIKKSMGEPAESLRLLQEALTFLQVPHAKPLEAYILTGLMSVSTVLNEPGQAIFYGKLAIKDFQEMRAETRILDPGSQKAYLRRVSSFYRDLTQILIDQHRYDEAQQVLNLSRDQEFFDLRNVSDPVRTEIQFNPTEEAVYTKWLSIVINARKVSIEGISIGSQTDPHNKDDNSENRYIDYFTDLANIKEDLHLVTQGNADFAISDINQIQNILHEFDSSSNQGTGILYTFIGKDKFYVLLNSFGRKIEIFESRINGEQFDKKVLQFHALLQSKLFDPRPLGKELYDVIICPDLKSVLEIRNIQILMWSLDGNLQYIPVASLFDGKKYLVERFNNVVFTRGIAIKVKQPAISNWTGYGFFASNPPNYPALDKNEMNVFRTASHPEGIIDGDVFADREFTKPSLFSISKQNRPLVHISSHFSMYPGVLDLSFLVLGNGDKLPLSEISEHSDLFNKVDLLTLSACNTATQYIGTYGREADTFAELAQRLGAASVLATLWSVTDDSTTLLMEKFYRNLQHEKMNKAESLRNSQLDLLYGKSIPVAVPGQRIVKNDKGSIPINIIIEEKYKIRFRPNSRFDHPYYWSPFVLFGNWR